MLSEKKTRQAGGVSRGPGTGRADEGRRRTDPQLESVLRAIPGMAFRMSGDGVFLDFVSGSGHRPCMPPAEFLGRKVQEVMPPAFGRRVMRAVERALRTREMQLLEYRLARPYPEGEQRECEARIIPSAEEEVLALVSDVTERKRAAQALREREKKFRTLAETVTAGTFITQAGRIRYANPAMETISGYTQDELLAMSVNDLVHPDSRELIDERGPAPRRGREAPQRYELKVLTKGGQERWVDFSGTVIEFEGEAAVLGTAFDITERKHAEEALRESEGRFRTLSEASSEGIVVHESGRIIAGNAALAMMFGYELSEMVGGHILHFVAPASRDLVSRNVALEYEGHYEVVGVRKDGTTFPFEARGGAATYQGRTVRVTALRDLTEQTRAEEALQILREQIEWRVERQLQTGGACGLTFRERTVLYLVADGKSDKEIAAALGIRPMTAQKHVSHILAKMEAGSRTEAAARALREELLT